MIEYIDIKMKILCDLEFYESSLRIAKNEKHRLIINIKKLQKLDYSLNEVIRLTETLNQYEEDIKILNSTIRRLKKVIELYEI